MALNPALRMVPEHFQVWNLSADPRTKPKTNTYPSPPIPKIKFGEITDDSKHIFTWFISQIDQLRHLDFGPSFLLFN